MLKYIFSALLIAAVWVTVLLLKLPYWLYIGIGATALILTILATVVIVQLVRARRSAREIEKTLAAQAHAQAEGARPDLKAEVDAMSAEFMRAVQSLKSSKLGGKSGTEALYALPWFVIIGPPGSGKSTALRNSGLRFPYMSKSGGAVQGVGGTRNCQWWMTNDAVILDTAGRYTTEDADRDEWYAFLDLLRKQRPRQPINGIMVAISVTEVAEALRDQVLARAREIRARIDEVMGKLEMVIPVYVLFTKCDLLPGFVEIFNDLSPNERGQIWGFTVPISVKGDPANQFVEHFNELTQGISRRSLRRMAEERNLDARDKIYAFPQYFEPMRDNLAAFVGELMAESIYTESPIFRGAYFTSGTQEGRPIDRIMNAMAEAFGVTPQANLHAPHVEARSYFLGGVFQQVIFPDKEVATRSAARLRRQARKGHLVATGLGIVATGMAVLPVLSFRANRSLLVDAKQAVQTIETFKQSETTDPMPIATIEPLRQVKTRFEEFPWVLRMGMYQGDKYGNKVDRLYISTLREQIVAPLLKLEVDKLKKFEQKYRPTNDEVEQTEHAEYRERLKLYLLLTGPSDKGEPGLQGKERAWLAEAVTRSWNERIVKLQLTGDISAMNNNMDAYARSLAADDNLLFDRDRDLVRSVRKILNRTDRTKALLEELLANVDAQNVTLEQLSGSRDALKPDRLTIRGRYTRPAWEDTIRARLENPFADSTGDEWVMGISGNDAENDREKLKEKVRSLYFEEYITEWNNFLRAIYVEVPDDYVRAEQLLKDLTRGATPPFKRLAQYVHYHTNLPDAPQDEASKDIIGELRERGEEELDRRGGDAAQAAKDIIAKRKRARDPQIKTQEDVKETFEGLAQFGYLPTPETPEGAPPLPPPDVPLDIYLDELRRVRDAVRAVRDNPEQTERKALESAVKDALRTTEGLLDEIDGKGWHSTLTKWLPPPLLAIKRLVDNSAGEDGRKAYCEQIYRPLTQDVLSRYPFTEKGRDLNLAQFDEYFKPGSGAVWKYYEAALSGVLTRRHGTFELSAAGKKRGYNPQLITFFNRLDDLTNVMYPPGSDAMRTTFDVRILHNPSASVTTLKLGKTDVSHANGPEEWVRIEWPGESPDGASIEAREQFVRGRIERQGEWGFFRLLEQATVSGSIGSEIFVVKWDLRDQDTGIVELKFRTTEDATPFFGTPQRPVAFMEVFRHEDLQPPRGFLSNQRCDQE